MEFKKYQHIERLGKPEVEGITDGECLVFSKLDGTNASLWLSENKGIAAGSRNREISDGKEDNHGFYSFIKNEPNKYRDFFLEYPYLRLYGEWLVSHTFKGYEENSWREFYVFDVTSMINEGPGGIDYEGYAHYDEYHPLLAKYGIACIPPIARITNGTAEDFEKLVSQSSYLVKDGGQGEGIVIKNYDYRNKFGCQVWAKIVAAEFKAVHGVAPDEKPLVEEAIARQYATPALIEKEYQKIATIGWTSKNIPQLLNTVFHAVITEESWNFLKDHRMPVIDFKRLQRMIFAEVRAAKADLF